MADLLLRPSLSHGKALPSESTFTGPRDEGLGIFGGGGITRHRIRNIWGMLEASGCGVSSLFSTHPWRRTLAERLEAKLGKLLCRISTRFSKAEGGVQELWKNREPMARRCRRRHSLDSYCQGPHFLCFHYYANFTLPRPGLGHVLLKAPEA
jgi:hypothetical protein